MLEKSVRLHRPGVLGPQVCAHRSRLTSVSHSAFVVRGKQKLRSSASPAIDIPLAILKPQRSFYRPSCRVVTTRYTSVVRMAPHVCFCHTSSHLFLVLFRAPFRGSAVCHSGPAPAVRKLATGAIESTPESTPNQVCSGLFRGEQTQGDAPRIILNLPTSFGYVRVFPRLDSLLVRCRFPWVPVPRGLSADGSAAGASVGGPCGQRPAVTKGFGAWRMPFRLGLRNRSGRRSGNRRDETWLRNGRSPEN